MKIRELRIQNFRGLADLTIRPNGHVVLMGEPRSGRSTVVDALARVLTFYRGRHRDITELDFHKADTSSPIRITLTVGELGPQLEQEFFDRLEVWDEGEAGIVEETDSPDQIDLDGRSWVVRVAYEAQWVDDRESADDQVFFPKQSDPSAGHFVRVRRPDLDVLNFRSLRPRSERPLDLGPRSDFREVVDHVDVDEKDFATAIGNYVEGVGEAARYLGCADQMQAALAEVLAPLRVLLGPHNHGEQSVRFMPDDGSTSGLLRSLGATFDFGDGTGPLPLWRQGQSVESVFKVAEVVAAVAQSEPILAIDDLGDRMDTAAAAHLAAELRNRAGQVWVTTRHAAVAEVFEPREVIRLGRKANGAAFVRQGRQPAGKADSIIHRQWHRNILPALSYRAAVVVEGPDDFAALHTLASRLRILHNRPLPASQGVAMISAAAGGSGGYAGALKVGCEASLMGLRAVAAIDGDTDESAKRFVESKKGQVAAVVRLPDQQAIEAAIIDGVSDDVLAQVLQELATAAGVEVPPAIARADGSELRKEAVGFIKRNSLHGPFIDSLPMAHLPTLAQRYLDALLDAATGKREGLVQL